MIKINNSTVRIISAVAIAIVLTASGLITFFNEESTFDNDSDTEYEIPADDRRDTVQSDTSFPDVSYPDTSVSSSDASKNATVSASDLPVNSDVQEEPDVPAEERVFAALSSALVCPDAGLSSAALCETVAGASAEYTRSMTKVSSRK